MKKKLLGPETVQRVFEKWAGPNAYRKAYNGYSYPITVENMSRNQREKFNSFLFTNGVYLRRINRKFYLESLNDEQFLMFALKWN